MTGGARGIGRAIALELASHTIFTMLHEVLPLMLEQAPGYAGYTETDMVAGVPEQAVERVLSRIQMVSLVKPEEIAHSVCSLVRWPEMCGVRPTWRFGFDDPN